MAKAVTEDANRTGLAAGSGPCALSFATPNVHWAFDHTPTNSPALSVRSGVNEVSVAVILPPLPELKGNEAASFNLSAPVNVSVMRPADEDVTVGVVTPLSLQAMAAARRALSRS